MKTMKKRMRIMHQKKMKRKKTIWMMTMKRNLTFRWLRMM